MEATSEVLKNYVVCANKNLNPKPIIFPGSYIEFHG